MERKDQPHPSKNELCRSKTESTISPEITENAVMLWHNKCYAKYFADFVTCVYKLGSGFIKEESFKNP